MLTIRKYNPTDSEKLAALFFETVHTVNAKDYSERQLNVWAPRAANGEAWKLSLGANQTFVAVIGKMIVGFGDIDRTGYLDRLFVHRDFQRQGIGTALCDVLERASETKNITTHASITAKPFFLSRGYRVTEKRRVVRDGIALTNYVMKKQINAAMKAESGNRISDDTAKENK